MIQVRREVISTQPIETGGRSMMLVGRQWSAVIRLPWIGAGATYTGPSHVELAGGERRAIRDYVLVARIVGFALVVLATLVRRGNP